MVYSNNCQLYLKCSSFPTSFLKANLPPKSDRWAHFAIRLKYAILKESGLAPRVRLKVGPVTGRLVEDGPTTDRFLCDFRRTVSELFTDNFYGHFADLCHENGAEFSAEPYTSSFEGLVPAP
jgi:hypothetical protein